MDRITDKGERLACLVPFCRRTSRNNTGMPASELEWICGPHWQATPRKWRRLLTARRRKLRHDRTEKNHTAFRRAWARCRDAAIAAGSLYV